MIPNFCKGCGKRLEGTEREVCSTKECLDFLRNTKTGLEESFRPQSSSRAMLVKQLQNDIRACQDNPRSGVPVKQLEDLLAKVKKHPWDDCRQLQDSRDALVFQGKVNCNQAYGKYGNENLAYSQRDAEATKKVYEQFYSDTDSLKGDVTGYYGPTKPADGWYLTYRVTLEGGVYIRSSPGGEKVKMVPQHASILSSAREQRDQAWNDWVQVIEPSGKPIGWACKRGLVQGQSVKVADCRFLSEPVPEGYFRTYTVSDSAPRALSHTRCDAVKLRQGPSSASSIVTTVPMGSTLLSDGKEEGEWVRIVNPDRTVMGWVTKYLVQQGPNVCFDAETSGVATEKLKAVLTNLKSRSEASEQGKKDSIREALGREIEVIWAKHKIERVRLRHVKPGEGLTVLVRTWLGSDASERTPYPYAEHIYNVAVRDAFDRTTNGHRNPRDAYYEIEATSTGGEIFKQSFVTSNMWAGESQRGLELGSVQTLSGKPLPPTRPKQPVSEKSLEGDLREWIDERITAYAGEIVAGRFQGVKVSRVSSDGSRGVLVCLPIQTVKRGADVVGVLIRQGEGLAEKICQLARKRSDLAYAADVESCQFEVTLGFSHFLFTHPDNKAGLGSSALIAPNQVGGANLVWNGNSGSWVLKNEQTNGAEASSTLTQLEIDQLRKIRDMLRLEPGQASFDHIHPRYGDGRLDAAPLPTKEAEVTDFVRKRTSLWRETWILPVLDRLLEKLGGK